MLNDGVRFAADARRAEGTARPLESAARAGSMVRVRRGAYADAEEWRGLAPTERHRRIAMAFVRSAQGPVTFAGETAAVLLGIPVVGPLPDRPVVAVPPGSCTSDAGAIRREIDLGDDVIAAPGGYAVSSPLRTAIALGAARGPDAAVVALSDVVRRWAVTPEQIESHVQRRRPFRGVRGIDAALPAVSALSETPIESLTMLRCHQLGFERPVQQIEHVIDGRLYRDDVEWPSVGVIGEADGRVKYVDPDALWREKVREDALRSICRAFVRIYASDLRDPATFAAKLDRAGVPRIRSRRPRAFAPTRHD